MVAKELQATSFQQVGVIGHVALARLLETFNSLIQLFLPKRRAGRVPRFDCLISASAAGLLVLDEAVTPKKPSSFASLAML
jgi:hypothetical protein